MKFLKKVEAERKWIWEDPNAEPAMKEHFSKEYNRTKHMQTAKQEEFKRHTQSLIIAIESYLTDRDEAPNEKNMVLVYKDHIKKILDDAKLITKLGEEWSKLERQYTEQLIGKK